MRATTRGACVGLAAVLALALAGCADRADPGDGQATEPALAEASDDPDATAADGPGEVPDEGTDGREAAGDVVDERQGEATGTDPGTLAFTARRLDGGTLDAASFAGGHVVLWMWTPW